MVVLGLVRMSNAWVKSNFYASNVGSNLPHRFYASTLWQDEGGGQVEHELAKRNWFVARNVWLD